MKNILYLANSYVVGGGASNVFNQLYNEALKEEENNVFLAATDLLKVTKNKNNFLLLDNSEKNILKILFNYKNYKLLNNFLKEKKIEIVYMHNLITALSPSVLLALKKNKVRVIYTLHQFDYVCPNSSLCNMRKGVICEKCIGKKIKWNILKERCSYKGMRYNIAKFLISLEKYLFKTDEIINYYVVPSDFSKEKMIQEGIKKEKIKVIKNFVKDKFWLGNQERKKDNNVVYFGRFSKEKNITLLIEAIKILKDRNYSVRLFLIGNGTEYQNYIKKINECEIEDNVTIINNFLNTEELKEILKKIKISILPSKWYETFGLTIIESIYANVIPVATNIGAMKETIEDSFGFTFENNNSRDLADKIEYILQNYDLEFNNLIKRKDNIRKDYSIERYLKELKNIKFLE